jgi:hypothetical protein
VFSSADNGPANRVLRQNVWQRSWPALVRIIILEILLLLALCGALVIYLNWSSDAAVSEFTAAGGHPLQTVKGRPHCGRSA